MNLLGIRLTSHQLKLKSVGTEGSWSPPFTPWPSVPESGPANGEYDCSQMSHLTGSAGLRPRQKRKESLSLPQSAHRPPCWENRNGFMRLTPNQLSLEMSVRTSFKM